MRLYQLIKPLPSFRARRALNDFYVKGISANSKSVKPGSVFVAVRGVSADGRSYIKEAVNKGARAVIMEPGAGGIPDYHGVNMIEVADSRRALSLLAAEFNRRPSSKMKVIGVTGTNGKTTVTYLIEAIIRAAGGRPGVIGTVNCRYGAATLPSKNTTPGPLELHALLRRMLRAGASHAVMEVSSHALDQERTGSVDFSAAIFTNLTQDHLDYHKNIGAYFAAKAKLFSALPPSAFALINIDDGYGRKLRSLISARVYTYGIGRGDIRAEKISMSVAGSSFTLAAPGMDMKITTGLIGRHNISNVLAAAGWALCEGIAPDTVRRAVEGFRQVPGRLEKVACRAGFPVFVDYAHTEDALKNVITALRLISAGRIIVVFGCGGDRDKGKRAKMGAVVSRLADYAVITNDNPRSEPPMEIIGEIVKGMRGKGYCVITDRRDAIRAALRQARKGDVVLVAGKGHENYQIFADGIVPFDDCETVRECSRSMK
jgi:UDP-N-acetylmuramoyl-L-alanyl-D-glutamate--2,6-diaminopimelate ligase